MHAFSVKLTLFSLYLSWTHLNAVVSRKQLDNNSFMTNLKWLHYLPSALSKWSRPVSPVTFRLSSNTRINRKKKQFQVSSTRTWKSKQRCFDVVFDVMRSKKWWFGFAGIHEDANHRSTGEKQPRWLWETHEVLNNYGSTHSHRLRNHKIESIQPARLA